MSRARSSTFRTALQVSPERIAAMSDGDLNELMRQLIRVQATKCGSPLEEVRINTEGKAKDQGCDGWSAKPATVDEWLGATDTCWQFKAGTAGQPARLTGEVLKPIPRETLASGGRLVVVASGSTSGKAGEDTRLKVLTSDVTRGGLPPEHVGVIGSERLANWCNQHPAIAAQWAGRPEGLCTLEEWSRSKEHQVPFQTTQAVEAEFSARRADLTPDPAGILHLHILGPPGVGKTRFALELCRAAAWAGEVVYFRQSGDFRLQGLISSAATEPVVRLVVVADEVQAEQLEPLLDSVERADGRIRLITIGHCPSPDRRRIPAFAVRPLDKQAMELVIKGWYPSLPPEHVAFVVRFADGYLKLARLAADAVARDPRTNVIGLLGTDEIRNFLDRMLGPGDRRALYVPAALTRVGWIDEEQEEGEAVSRCLGLDWDDVRATVDRFDREYGIVPRGGRYRYVSPKPLAVYLAVEAWTTYTDHLRSLPSALPTERARDAYYQRIRTMASSPQAKQLGRQELALFSRLEDFEDARAACRWSVLSSVDPELAAQGIVTVLRDMSIDARCQLQGTSRREVVSALTSLTWRSSTFRDATKALALLAEAENETWANNATGEFIARFQIFLGGTAVPFPDRLTVLDELVAEKGTAIASLVVKALAQAVQPYVSRTGGEPASDELPEREWRPSSGREHLECVEAAISRLISIANQRMGALQEDLVGVAKPLSEMLRHTALRNLAAAFLDAVREAYPTTREPLRQVISRIIEGEKAHWKQLPAEELEAIERIHSRFEDSSLSGRLQQYVGQPSWSTQDQPDLLPLAAELVASSHALAEHWAWLTSGDAVEAWRLGVALAAVDPKGGLAAALSSLSGGGRDHRLLCGYVFAQRRNFGDNWYDTWVSSVAEREPILSDLVLEVAWRCGVTEHVAALVSGVLRSKALTPEVVGRLAFGQWAEGLSLGSIQAILRAMVDTANVESAVAVLHDRMTAHPEEAGHWGPLALELVASSTLIRGGHMATFHWKEVATLIMDVHAAEIAAAVFREHADRETETWFAEHSDAATVLLACAEHDPGGTWRAIEPHLWPPGAAYSFSIGFPRGVVERIPWAAVKEWIAEDPGERAPILSNLASPDLATDDTLASRMLGTYGDDQRVASAFFSVFVSGVSWGPTSAHWERLAVDLDAVVTRTGLAQVRRWATRVSHQLRQMAARDREREAEEELGGR